MAFSFLTLQYLLLISKLASSEPAPLTIHKASSDSHKETPLGISQGHLALIPKCLPAIPVAPILSPFLDNFLDELEKFNALTLSSDQADPNILEEITLEIKEEPSALLPLPPTSPPAESSYSFIPFLHRGEPSAASQPSETMPWQNCINTTQGKFSDLIKMRRSIADPIKTSDILGDKFVASAPPNVGSLPQILPVIGEEDEDIFDGVISNIQRWSEFQKPGDLWGSHDDTVVTPNLHIEEEEEKISDEFKSLVAITTDARIPKEDRNVTQASNEVFSFCQIADKLNIHTTLSS